MLIGFATILFIAFSACWIQHADCSFLSKVFFKHEKATEIYDNHSDLE